MYCAGCGNLISAELNYCKSCGMRLLSEEKSGNSNRILATLIITFGVITIVGLGILLALIALLLDRGASEKTFGIIVVFYLASFTAIEFVLGTQISKLINANVTKEKKNAIGVASPTQLSMPTTAQLEEYRQPAQSVTEHTTRTLEEVSLKRV